LLHVVERHDDGELDHAMDVRTKPVIRLDDRLESR
jgi:hypothetical protein